MTLNKIKDHYATGINAPIRIIDYLNGIFEELPTRSSLKKAFKAGRILLNGQLEPNGTFLQENDLITLLESENDQVKPYPLEIEIIFEDEHLLIVNKPAGLPTSGNLFRNLENALEHTCILPTKIGYLKHAKPVHRLDSLTSGLVICAKTINARYMVSQLFEDGKIQKTYHALVMGETPESGLINFPIDDKPSSSLFSKVKSVRSLKNSFLTLLRLHPETGRTHQLRIHCAKSGFPIYGDHLYADATIKSKGLFLSCTELKFVHPIRKEQISVSIPLPSKFENRMKNEQARWDKYHSELSFVKPQPEDFEALLAFAKENFRLTYEHLNDPEDFKIYMSKSFDPEAFRKEINNPNSHFILLKKDNQILGYFKLNIGEAQTESKPDQYAELERVYIDAQNKGLGHGKQMLQYAFEYAREQGKTKLWLGVWELNENAQKFYTKMGFEITGKHVFLLGKDEQTDYIMELTL